MAARLVVTGFIALVFSCTNRCAAQAHAPETGQQALLLRLDGKNVLQYNYGTTYPPTGVDTLFKRSGYIHPLWSPAGNRLTRISPPDHYHHYGIWNPWTKVLFRGRVTDFWNLRENQGTVRFARFLNEIDTSNHTGFAALHEHVVFNADGTETVAMNEKWTVTVSPAKNNRWIVDFVSELQCATPDSVVLEEYRYGGFGFRATEAWNKNNSRVLSSENHDRKTADSTRAKWCIVEGEIGDGRSGILFMGHPQNFNFPEPMRVWPENMNGRGDVFFSFSPTKNKNRVLLPGKTYTFRYRMLVYDGQLKTNEAETAWKQFSKTRTPAKSSN